MSNTTAKASGTGSKSPPIGSDAKPSPAPQSMSTSPVEQKATRSEDLTEKMSRMVEQLQLSMQAFAQALGASQLKPPSSGSDPALSASAPLATAQPVEDEKEKAAVIGQLSKLSRPSQHSKRTAPPPGGLISALSDELQGKKLPPSTSTDKEDDESSSDGSDSAVPEIDANTVRQTKAMAKDIRKQGGPRRWFRASEWFNHRNEKEAEFICEALALLRKQGVGDEWLAVGYLQRRLQGLQAADALLKEGKGDLAWGVCSRIQGISTTPTTVPFDLHKKFIKQELELRNLQRRPTSYGYEEPQQEQGERESYRRSYRAVQLYIL